MDFSVKKYKELLDNLCKSGYSFQTFHEFVINPMDKVIVLRHDVDKLPLNSLKFARIQNHLGICGSYYFRVYKSSFDAEIIKEIAAMGHEVGYHYETMDTCKGNIDLAYKEFCLNLEKLGELVPVQTICMHGSPMSRFDNKTIWGKYNYKELGILAEPYFDVDFNKVFYITDTGRKLDGEKVSIRDKTNISSKQHWPLFHSTNDVIKALQNNNFPKVVLFTFHPQRWTDNLFYWTRELVLQNIKNAVKRIIVKQGS